MTGLRTSDNDLRTTYRAGRLFHHIIQASKPQLPKLASVLDGNPEFERLPNVKIASRRITPIDKERAVGRWKVIEKELMDRGLPVTGD